MAASRRSARKALLPWQLVLVAGPSMTPTLRHGDRIVVKHGAAIRAGDLVLARYRSMPDRMVVKRTLRPQDGGWWLTSDNAFAGGDSAVHGVADVAAKVIARVGPGWPRRVRGGTDG